MRNKDVVVFYTYLMNTLNSSGFKPIHFPSAMFLVMTCTPVTLVFSMFSVRKDNDILTAKCYRNQLKKIIIITIHA